MRDERRVGEGKVRAARGGSRGGRGWAGRCTVCARAYLYRGGSVVDTFKDDQVTKLKAQSQCTPQPAPQCPARPHALSLHGRSVTACTRLRLQRALRHAPSAVDVTASRSSEANAKRLQARGISARHSWRRTARHTHGGRRAVLEGGAAPPKLAEGTRATPIVRTVAWPVAHPCAKEHEALDGTLGGVLHGT